MSDINPVYGWDIRNVEYEKIHGVKPEDMDVLVGSLDLHDGDVVLDLMSSYGAVTKRVLDYCSERGISVTPYMMDVSRKQLDRSDEYLRDVTKLLGDARYLRTFLFKEGCMDKIVIKMGIHEVPKVDQQEIVNGVHWLLKHCGIFSVWSTIPLTEEDQTLLQDIIRKKDELAGFESFVRDRYMFRQDELEDCLRAAGFIDVMLVREMEHIITTEGRLRSEFSSDISKLEDWNDYIRQRVPENMKPKIQYEDSGNSITMSFREGIITAMK